ncbi:MAG: peptidylprolyl isomerase [Flavobacteriales bacterium]|nr:peptidylprolyl isomerase [Flavobacteriales bacterium]
MAILGQIRKKIWILFVFVGLAMFAFLFNPSQWANYFKSNPNIYGEVNGENISKQEFGVMKSFMSRGRTISEEQIWKTMVQNKLIAEQFDKAGLKLTDESFWDFAQLSSIFANDRSLYNEKGEFDPTSIKDYITNLEEKAKTDKQSEEAYLMWLEQKKIAEYEIKAKIYFQTLSKGLLVNSEEANIVQEQRIKNAQIEFVNINYETYNQKNEVKVTDEEIKQYIEKYPKRFKRDASIDLEYAIFKNKSTPQDDSSTLEKIKIYLNGGIIKDEQGKEIDSVRGLANLPLETKVIQDYVNDFSDDQNKATYLPISRQPAPIKEWVKSSTTGDTFGPYEFNNQYIISRNLGQKTIDSTLSKHILISYKESILGQRNLDIKRSKEDAKKLADSLFNAIGSSTSKFDELLSFSDDTSKENGGNVGWTTTDNPKFVPSFQEFVERNPKGEIGLVESQFGYHIIQVADKKKGDLAYYITHIVKEKNPSDKTTENVFSQATAFAQKVQDKSVEDFETIAKKENIQTVAEHGVGRFVGYINGISTDKVDEILTWAFNNERSVGDSEMFTTSTGDHYIVKLTAKNKAGLATPAMVRDGITTVVRNEKIAKILSDKINSSKKSLAQLADEFKTTKDSTSINFANPIIANYGSLPQVAGVAFGIKTNVVSKAIETPAGVFVIEKKSEDKNGAKIDVKQLEKGIAQQLRQIAPRNILAGIEDNAKIEDYRIEARQ